MAMDGEFPLAPQYVTVPNLWHIVKNKTKQNQKTETHTHTHKGNFSFTLQCFNLNKTVR